MPNILLIYVYLLTCPIFIKWTLCLRVIYAQTPINFSNCRPVTIFIKLTLLLVVIQAQTPINMSNYWPVTIFTKWMLYCWWSFPNILSICEPADLSPFLQSGHFIVGDLCPISYTTSIFRPVTIFIKWIFGWLWSLPQILSIYQSATRFI